MKCPPSCTPNVHTKENSLPKDVPKSPRKRKVHYPPKSDFVALDCEMVGIGKRGRLSSAARVTVVDWFGTVLLDECIVPNETVTDYRTHVSGIQEEDLQNATMALDECREQVLNLVRNKVLVGHSLKNDLKALGIQHPWWLIRDTAKYAPFMQDRLADGVLWPRKLKDLVREMVHREIQLTGQPHSPYEDALASLDLYKSVRQKWEKLMCYNIEKTKRIQQHQRATQ